MAARCHGHGQGSIVVSDDAHDGEYPFRHASIQSPHEAAARSFDLHRIRER
jgi:hypothetical protein